MVATYNSYPQDTLWVGKHWKNRINLGVDSTWVEALSADGNIAGGFADNYGYRAVIWSGENWQTETDLGTLMADNSGNSVVNALSADGNIAGGFADNDRYARAVIWSGENWRTKTDLGTLRANNLGHSRVYALSADGNIAGGRANSDSGNTRAVIWSGENWQTKTDLGTLTADNSGISEVRALSADGSIAGGYANNRAVIWSGENWQTKTDLGTLSTDNSGPSTVRALSADGKIAGGYAASDSYHTRAVIWSGENWQTKTDLGTLRADNSGRSTVYALSADGTLAGGSSQAYDGEYYATLWRLKYDDNRSVTEHKPLTEADKQPEQPTEPSPETPTAPEPAEPTTPVAEPTQPTSPTPSSPPRKPETPSVPLTPLTPAVEIVGKINVDFTHKALRQFGADTLNLMAMQQHALSRLQQSCVNSQGHCYRITSDVSGMSDSKDTSLGFGYGYRLENGVMLGLNLDRSLQRQLPQSYQRTPNNMGVGIFANWQGDRWFVTPAVAWDFYNAKTKRPQFSHTEADQQTTKIKGLAASLTFGQRINWADKQVGWYMAGRFSQVTRSGYTEQNLAFPIQFGKTQLQETTLALGLNSHLPLSPKLSWLLNTEVEQKLKGKNPVYTAQGESVGDFRFEGKANRTRLTFGTGLRYAFTPNVRVEVMPYVERTSFGGHRYGSRFNLVGSF